MLNPNVDWEAVVGVLQQRFPLELEVAILVVHASKLEAMNGHEAPEEVEADG